MADYLFAFTFSNAQDTEGFVRKGRILVEATSSGFSFEPGDGNSTQFAADGGYFLSNDFALKGGLGFSSIGDFSRVAFMGGGKYYIIGKIPVEAVLGTSRSEGFNYGYAQLSAGYGIRLADNINFEPHAAFFMPFTENEFISLENNFYFAVRFSLFL